MSSSWKDKFTPSKAVSHEVGGVEHYFYPISTGSMIKLKSVGEPLINALSVMFSRARRANDVKHTVEKTEDSKMGVAQSRTTVEGIPLDLAQMRAAEDRQAVRDLVEALSLPRNVELIGGVIKDSMREIEEFKGKGAPTGTEVVESFDVVQFREVITGVLKGNAGVFGPLGGKLMEAAKEAVQEMTPGTA